MIENHFARRGPAGRSGRSIQYEHDLAILANDDERSPPSNREALKRFERAARAQGFDVEFLDRDDYGRIAEFDALFIRETTNVNHHTYRFASRARAEGMVVIDDPESIIRCGNKVYLVELAKRLDLAIPPTMVVSSARTDDDRPRARPAVRAEAARQRVLRGRVPRRHARGAVGGPAAAPVAQRPRRRAVVHADRVRLARRRCSTASRCSSAGTTWPTATGRSTSTARRRTKEGEHETLAVQHAPREVLQLALKTANAVGDGFYGVDIKTVNGRQVLMEINDNPSVDRGVEDAVLGDELYERVMKVFKARVDAGKQFKPAG